MMIQPQGVCCGVIEFRALCVEYTIHSPRTLIFADIACSRVQSGMFRVLDLSKGFRFQSPSPLSIWLVG